jgi:starch phosphorylase
MAEAAGEENFFLFGLSAEEVARTRGFYHPQWHYDHEPEIRAALDLIGENHFSRHEPGVFMPIVNALLQYGDYYLHPADSKVIATLIRGWESFTPGLTTGRESNLNIAGSGTFSSDHTIAARNWTPGFRWIRGRSRDQLVISPLGCHSGSGTVS